MYSRAGKIISLNICAALSLLLAGTISASDDIPIPIPISIPPGGYAWSVFSDSLEFSDFETVSTIAPGPLPGFSSLLPDSAVEAIRLSADWLKSDLAVRFTDLLYRDVYGEMPITPCFADVNGDGLADMILESESHARAFMAPNWLEATDITGFSELGRIYGYDIDKNGTPDSSYLSDQGVLTLYSGDSILQITPGFDVSAVTGTALGDMEGDDLADLVVCTGAGNVLVFRNRGTAAVPCFLPFFSESRTMFPMNSGAFSSPVLFALNDSVLALAVGTRQDGLSFYSSSADNSPSPSPIREWSALNAVQCDNRYLNISPVVVNLSGESLVICGTRDGILYEGRPCSDSLMFPDLPPVPGTYPNLALARVNEDEFPDLVAGTMEGEVYFLPGLEGWFHGNWTPVDDISPIPSGAPASWKDGLVFGSADGTLRYFKRESGGNWTDCTEGSEFCSIDAGEYSTPFFFDMNNDNLEELIIGNSTGSLDFYEKSADESPFLESFSWEFQPAWGAASNESYYSRYFSPHSIFRSPSGESTVNAFAGEIINADPRYRDEIAYCIANTPTEILRVIEENGDVDLFHLNARSLYDAAGNLSYVRLLDSDQGTSCELKTAEGWFEVSRENYYRFVVHPGILFEVPGRIDATYWSTPRDSAASTQREYLNYQPDSLYGDSPDHVFWREFIPSDSSRGRTLEQRMMDADSYEEAVFRLCNFQSHSQPGGIMSFGYMTNDLQPITIYSKAYGSCGEQSILQTALCRAFFIPAYVVGCRGEDHQWNHYLDPESGRWNHWDINYGISGIGNLWVSGEGVDHKGKTISTISAFGSQGEVWPVTGSVLVPPGSGYMDGDSGYTRTAHVDIRVTDPDGLPVGGAMVLIRSHWDNANAVTAFDYTDDSGNCIFDLGWEPYGGYTIDVISPFGSGGSSNIGFTEDSFYTVNYILPFRMPQKQEISLPVSDYSNGIPVLEKFYSVPYFTGSLYPSADNENEDFLRSSDWVPWRETLSAGEVMYMDGRNFRNYRNGLNCNAVRNPFVPHSGDSCFAVLDNRNSMFTWREYTPLLSPSTHTENAPEWLDGRSTDRIPVAGSCIPANDIGFDDGSSQWIKNFPDMEILQDDPEYPLSAELVIGPFRIPSGERDLSVGTSCNQSDLDLDLFLFTDRNGNRTVDGMSELLTSSTSATSSEIVFITDPDTSAVYWIYLHGWQVEEGGGRIDLGLSFEPETIVIHSLSPTGSQRILPQQFSFATVDSFNTGDIFLQSGETVIFPEKEEDRWHFAPLSPGDFFADGSVQLFLSNGELVEILKWDFSLDIISPELSIYSAEVDYLTMQALVEIECTDTLSGIEKIVLSMDSLESIELVFREDSLWNCSIDFLPFSGKTVSVDVCAVDSAGNETKENFEISVLKRPAVVFSSVYPSGTVYDHTPVLQIFADFENPIPGWTAVAMLSGDGFLQELAPCVVDGNIIQFSVKEFLQDGGYRAKVQILGPNGVTVGEHFWIFTVASMTAS